MQELSLEQEFNLRSFEIQVQSMSLGQAQDFLVEMYRQMMIQENSYKNLIVNQWGLMDPTSLMDLGVES